MKYFSMLLAAALSGFTLTACSSPGKVTKEVDANGKKIEYVYYTPVGTNIPVRIRKDLLQTSDQQSAADQDALRKAVLKGMKQDKQPGG